MSQIPAADNLEPVNASPRVRTERTFQRFTLAQRWEHGIIILSFLVLLLTGLPQKYFELWGHRILTTPESLSLVRQIHRIGAIVLILEVIFHLVRGIVLLARRRLSSAIFPNWQDVRDAGRMLKYLLFLSDTKPSFGKYNFEQKFTYWFLAFGIVIMVISGLILWFPLLVTRVISGGIVPAAQQAHSSEAIIATIFIIIWHFYHVHFERLNLSIFTGRLSEEEMRTYHAREYHRLTGESVPPETRSAVTRDEGEAS